MNIDRKMDVPLSKVPPVAVVVGGLRFPTENAFKNYLARTTGRNAIIQAQASSDRRARILKEKV